MNQWKFGLREDWPKWPSGYALLRLPNTCASRGYLRMSSELYAQNSPSALTNFTTLRWRSVIASST